MSGFITGLLNIALMVVLGLTLLIERGQHYAAMPSAGSSPPTQASPEDILASPRPEQYRSARTAEDSIVSPRASVPNANGSERPGGSTESPREHASEKLLNDVEVVSAFLESWFRRLSIELYNALLADRQLSADKLQSADLPEPLVQPAQHREIKPDARLMRTIRIPADQEPIVLESL